MPLKIKKTYEDHIIGFNNSSLPLGLRSDLDLIFQHAKRKNLYRWLSWFEEEPNQEELDKVKEDRFNQRQQLKAVKQHASTGNTEIKQEGAEGTGGSLNNE